MFSWSQKRVWNSLLDSYLSVCLYNLKSGSLSTHPGFPNPGVSSLGRLVCLNCIPRAPSRMSWLLLACLWSHFDKIINEIRSEVGFAPISDGIQAYLRVLMASGVHCSPEWVWISPKRGSALHPRLSIVSTLSDHGFQIAAIGSVSEKARKWTAW